MLRRPSALGFVILLTLLAQLHVATSADAASVGRQCRRACRGDIAAVPTTGHSYKGLGLAQSTTYYYRLRASDSTGLFSAYSSVASATTSADTTAPSTPSGLQASASACGQTSLGWSASTDGGSG